MSFFTTAQIALKRPEKDLGKWDFVELPSSGHALAVTINDKPVALLVESVIHRPVMHPALQREKLEAPSVVIFVSLPEGTSLDD